MLLIDLGKHAAFIWASYAAVFVVLAGLIVWLIWQGQSYEQARDELERRGVRRRSSQ